MIQPAHSAGAPRARVVARHVRACAAPGRAQCCVLPLVLLSVCVWGLALNAVVARAAGIPTTAPTPPQAADANAPSAEPKNPTSQPGAAAQSWFELDHLTGDWGGRRPQLEEHGFSFALVYHSETMVNLRGGRETRNGNDFAGGYDLDLLFDFGRMGLLPGAEFFIQGQGLYGGGPGDFDARKIGGLFATNFNAGEAVAVSVSKWHYRQRLLDDRVEFQLGKLDTTDTFDGSDYANAPHDQFMNAALAGNPTLPHKVGLGAYLNVWPTDWLYARGAAVDHDAENLRTGFDTAFHGRDYYRAYSEVGVLPHHLPGVNLPRGSYRVGTWYVPGPQQVFLDDLHGRRRPEWRSGDVGFYCGADQLVWAENPADPNDAQGLGVFARYGFAHGDVNLIEHFWSTGVQYTGLVPGRDADVLGLGVGQGLVSDDYRRELNPDADPETAYELYYAVQLAPWLHLTPDFQVITNPGGIHAGRTTYVAGLRLKVDF